MMSDDRKDHHDIKAIWIDGKRIECVTPRTILANARTKPVQRDESCPSADGTKRSNR